jgi:hypothetical protein
LLPFVGAVERELESRHREAKNHAHEEAAVPLPEPRASGYSDAMCSKFYGIENGGDATYDAEAAVHGDIKSSVVVGCKRVTRDGGVREKN